MSILEKHIYIIYSYTRFFFIYNKNNNLMNTRLNKKTDSKHEHIPIVK